MSAVPSRAIRFHATGEPLEVLREEQVVVPDPPAGRIRVRTLATGLNPADWELCRGFMPGALPRGIGYDVAGIVEAVGEGVDRGAARVADVVFGTADFVNEPSAGAAEAVILNAWSHVPEGLDPVRAATLPMVVQTAAWTLEVMDLQPGATLLVHGAGGMVGYDAVQMALTRGVTVIATAGPTFASDLEGFGALVTGYGDGMTDRVRSLTAGDDVNLVLDTARPSGGVLHELIALAGGDPRRVMTISNHDEARALGARVNLDERRPGLTPLTVLMARYASLVAQGAFRLPIARSFPFERWRDAVGLSLSGYPHGKVVLLPTGHRQEVEVWAPLTRTASSSGARQCPTTSMRASGPRSSGSMVEARGAAARATAFAGAPPPVLLRTRTKDPAPPLWTAGRLADVMPNASIDDMSTPPETHTLTRDVADFLRSSEAEAGRADRTVGGRTAVRSLRGSGSGLELLVLGGLSSDVVLVCQPERGRTRQNATSVPVCR